MPLNKMYKDAFSFRMRQLQELGKYKEFKTAAEKKVIAAPACVEEDAGGTQDGADFTSMAGTLVISIFCQLVALALCAIETRTGRPIQRLLGFHMTEEDDDTEECQGVASGGKSDLVLENVDVDGSGRKGAWSSNQVAPYEEHGGSDIQAQNGEIKIRAQLQVVE